MAAPESWPWSRPGRLATIAGDPGKKLGTCTEAEDTGWKEELPPVYKSPLSCPISCSLFALTGSENYLGVITTASLLPGESVAVCGVSWFQAHLLKSGVQGRLPSDQRPWVINVGLFINGVRRHRTSEAAVVTSIWKVKSDPIATTCGWKIDKEFVLRFPPFVFLRWGGDCVRHPESPNRHSLLPCRISIPAFLLWLLFHGLSYLLAELRQSRIGRSAITRLTYISQLCYFNFFTWPLALAWQHSSTWVFCSGKVLREEEKNCHSPRMWIMKSFPRAAHS